MRNIYPRTLPEYLREFPWFLKGKAAQAADMFLSSRCDYDGVRACEMAAILLDEEIISEDSVYSFAERMEILTFAHEVDDWYADYG
ncbi:MAG: hypothetical protein K2H64_12870, partial [Desulfovibrio sp.]|nr:hypothetical protein [Desulfovibrio sp.]